MKKTLAFVGATLAAILFSGSVPSSPYISILEREIQKLTERGLLVQLLGEVVEATDPVSGQKWQFSTKMLTPRQAAYTGLPTLTIDLRTLDTNQYNWKYHYVNTIPISSEWGFAIPIADVDRDGHAEAYGLYQTPGNDIRTRIYEETVSSMWLLTYTYPTEGGWVDRVEYLDTNYTEIFVRLGDTLYVYGQPSTTQLPTQLRFAFRQYYGEAFGIPNEVVDMNDDGRKDVLYRGSEMQGQIFTPKTYVAKFDSETNNLIPIWSQQLPPGCFGTNCAGSIAAGDFDKDGRKEFVTSSFYGKVYVVERVFADSVVVVWSDSLSVAGRVAAGDVDGNGIEEFFVGGTQAESDGYVHLRMYAYEGTSDNSYEPTFAFNIFPAGVFFVDLYQTMDLDGDGQRELLLSFAGGVLVIKGVSTRAYELFYHKPVSLLLGIAGGDLDADGFSEFFISRQSASGGWTEVYRLDTLFTQVSGNSWQAPGSFVLHQNFPNPFNPSTSIRFDVPYRSHVKLSIFDLIGREIKVLTDGEYEVGSYTVLWTPQSQKGGEAMAGGVYLYRLQIGNNSVAKKILYLK